MRAFEKSVYAEYEVTASFRKIVQNSCTSYEGTKKEQLKSFLEDLQKGGCMSGMISEFIYNSDCRKFYTAHLDDLENIRYEIEDNLGEPVKNRHRLPHYTFVCWLCFEEYCFDIYRNSFEKYSF
jgi:hypothetical protein